VLNDQEHIDTDLGKTLIDFPSVYLYLLKPTHQKVKSQKQGRRQILAPIIIKSYNGWINQKRGKENENKQKKELLNFPLIFSL